MTFPRLDVGPAQPGVVQRGRHQSAVTPGVREAHKIAPRADAVDPMRMRAAPRRVVVSAAPRANEPAAMRAIEPK